VVSLAGMGMLIAPSSPRKQFMGAKVTNENCVQEPMLQDKNGRRTGRKAIAGLALIALAFAATSPARAENAGMRVIVNAKNPIVSMARIEVSKLFLGKSDKWPDGSAAAPLDLAGKTPTRKLFCQEVLGKQIDAVESQWRQLIFAGEVAPPPTKPTEQEAVAFVSQHPGAIAYVSYAVDLTPGVKELTIR
jgi:hypothetical protein